MSEQLTLIEEAFGLTVVEGENLQLTLDGGNGPAGPVGPAGAAGAAGPNTITTSTTAPSLNGYIFGNGTTIAGATAAASAATPSTLVVRTSGGAASFTGITNNGALTLSTGTTFTYGAGIAAAHRTALGLGSLATQSGTFSGTSSGTNTGDQDLSGLLPRLSRIAVTDVFDSNSDTLTFAMLETGILDGLRYWETGYGQLYHDLGKWFLIYNDGSGSEYRAEITSSSEEPWALTGWTIVLGAGQPSFTIDPPVLLPINAATGTIALATDQQGRVSPADMIGFGSGVFNGLISDINNNGGFLTAGTGGTLPIARGGTGATTAGLARTNLGSGATGDALFTAATPSAARTTLGVRTFTKSANQSKFNDTTYADDSELKDIPLEIGKSYKIEFYIAAYLPLTEGGKARLLVPYGNVSAIQAGFVTTAQWGNSSTGPINIINAATRIFSLADSAGYNQTRALSGVAYTGTLTQSGVLSLQWAQRTSGANAMIMQAGSLITVTEL